MLEIDPQTVTNSAKTGQLTRRVRDSLERALQEGIGSAADRQRRRNEKLHVRALESATDLQQGAVYDAHYLALAEDFGCELWTADQRFHRAAGGCR